MQRKLFKILTNRRRRKAAGRLACAFSSAAFLTVTTLPAQAANGMLIPICANGAITYIVMSFEDENEAPDQDRNASACHGPCLHERKRAAGDAKKNL